MKGAEYLANTLTGPWWLLGDKAKWLLSDLVCLSAAVLHLWLPALAIKKKLQFNHHLGLPRIMYC